MVVKNGVETYRYYLTNTLGTTSLALGEDGAILEESDTNPYGDIRYGSNNNEVTTYYGLHERNDTTGLIDMEARMYDPTNLQFSAPDPISLYNPTAYLSDPSQMHMYAYAKGNPIRHNDPDGREPNAAQAGTVEGFVSIMNNSPRGVGNFTGEDASVYLQSLSDTKFKKMKIEPTQTSYFNTKQNRYIYTENGGWVDMVHFLFYAGKAYDMKLNEAKDSKISTVSAGRRQEFLDSIIAKHSAFSYEDLPSDSFGADFALNYFDSKSNLSFSQQVSSYMNNVLGAKNPATAPNYSTLPKSDSKNKPTIKNRTTTPVSSSILKSQSTSSSSKKTKK